MSWGTLSGSLLEPDGRSFDESQGFLFSKRLPALEIEQLLRALAQEAPLPRGEAHRTRTRSLIQVPAQPDAAARQTDYKGAATVCVASDGAPNL